MMKTGFYKNDIPIANQCTYCHVNTEGEASTQTKEKHE
jgi:hypothetical protein